MNSSTSEQPKSARDDRGVLCARCEHLNAWGRAVCTVCRSDLFLECAACGHRNERVRTRCTECHAPLRHTVWERLRGNLKSGLPFDRFHFVLFCVGVALAFGLIFVFSRLHLPGGL